jgi:hypothetical protein
MRKVMNLLRVGIPALALCLVAACTDVSSPSPGPGPVDKAALTAMVTSAATNIESAVVSADGTDVESYGVWVTQADKTAYQTAITAAQAVLDNAGATQADVDAAVDSLTAATTAFNNAKQPGSKTITKETLTEKVTAAGGNKESVAVSVDGSDVDAGEKWVTQADKTAYEAAIAAAQAVYDKTDATSEEITAAAKALDEATAAFNAAKQAGTKAADKEALTGKITAAGTNIASVEVSTDGSNVDPEKEWVTQADKTAYQAAITAAQAVLDNSSATDAEIAAAAVTLDAATAVFNAAKKAGTKAVNKASLTNKITAAGTNLASVVVSVDGSEVDPDKEWVTQADKTAYQAAISAAQAVVDNAGATQAEVDAAVIALDGATTTFNAAKQAGTRQVDVSELNAQIAEAEAKIAGVEQSADGNDVDPEKTWVTPAIYQALEAAIASAKATADAESPSEEAVTAAFTALSSALTAFVPAPGTKIAGIDEIRVVRYAANTEGNALVNTGNGGTENYQATLKGSSAIIDLNGLKVIDTGNPGSNTNFGVDLGAGTGALLYEEDAWSIETFVYVPAGYSDSGNGHFIWSFAETESITQANNAEAGGTIWLQEKDLTYHAGLNGWNNATATAAAAALTKGVWKHVVVTKNSEGAVTVYVDGAQVSTGTGYDLSLENYDSLAYNYLGRSCFAGNGDNALRNSRYFAFSVYNAVLTPELIGQLRDEYLAQLNRNGDGITVRFVNAADETINLGTGQALSWLAGATLQVTAPAGYEAYRWFLNGALIAEAGSNTYTVNARSCALGVNYLAVEVTKNGIKYTKNLRFTVE